MQSKSNDNYIRENFWYITASKLKCFIQSPEQFFLKYIKELPELQEKEKRHFIIWTAIDDYISYWENEFNKKYFIDECLLKWELEERLNAIGIDPKWLKVDDMKSVIYWDITSKIRLTAWEWIMINWIIKEFNRQTLFDKLWWYENQKTYIWQYKSLKLKWTLDRTKENEIRDTKSTSDIKKFMWERRDLWYDVSMAFYWVLKNKATGEKSRLIFDVAQKTFPYPSRVFEIPQGEILTIIENTIIPALDTLDSMMIAWEKTKDESIWEVKTDFAKLSTCDFYPIMKTAIQTEVEYLQ